MPVPYPLSRELLEAVLEDRTSDRFVCELIWPRLGYEPDGAGIWSAGPATEASWRESFPAEPQFIAERPASVAAPMEMALNHHHGGRQGDDTAHDKNQHSSCK